jgi:hypothetical protein
MTATGSDNRTDSVRRAARSRSALASAYVSGDAVWGLFLAVAGAFGYRVASTMEVGQAHDPLGGRFFPVTVSLLLLVAAVIVLLTPLVRALLGLRQIMGEDPGAALEITLPDEDDEEPGPLGRPMVRVALMIVVAVTFVVVMQWVTFVPGSILGMAGAMWLLGARRIRSLLIGPIGMSIATYYVFTEYLLVRLP